MYEVDQRIGFQIYKKIKMRPFLLWKATSNLARNGPYKKRLKERNERLN